MNELVTKLRGIGEDVIALADYLAAHYAKPIEEEAPKEKSQTVEPAPKAPKPAIKMEDIRSILAEISRSGKTAEMKALLGKFGATKLSDVKAEDYAALLEAAQEVKNA